MSSNDNPVTLLDEDQAWNLLAGAEVGRLATTLGGRPEVFPVNYVVDNNSVVFRTAEGNKLLSMAVNNHVAFEADGWDEESGWSVVIHGQAETITHGDDLARAERLPLRPWVPTIKLHYVRVTADEINARRFAFGPEPEGGVQPPD